MIVFVKKCVLTRGHSIHNTFQKYIRIFSDVSFIITFGLYCFDCPAHDKQRITALLTCWTIQLLSVLHFSLQFQGPKNSQFLQHYPCERTLSSNQDCIYLKTVKWMQIITVGLQTNVYSKRIIDNYSRAANNCIQNNTVNVSQIIAVGLQTTVYRTIQ